MKSKLHYLPMISVLLCLLGNTLMAQSGNAGSPDTVMNIAELDVKPAFPDGFASFYQYFQKAYKCPAGLEKGISGKVFVTFTVEKDGSLSSVKCIRDIGHGTGDEAVRVVRESPKWTPGIKNGRPVRVQFMLPLIIKT
jgi:protein TonB